jgi:hypothetical protein
LKIQVRTSTNNLQLVPLISENCERTSAGFDSRKQAQRILH